MLIMSLTTEKCTFKWVQARKDSIPKEALVAGRDLNDEILRVCRMKVGNNELVAGKADNTIGCVTSYAGREANADSFEVLVASNVEWVSRHGTDPLPEHALIISDKGSAHTYVGRCLVKDSVQIGKIDYGMYYGLGGKELKDCANHEVLVCVQ